MGPRDKERARLIFEMRKNGASHKEIAEAIGCTEQASKALCSKNRIVFDQRMAEDDARRMVESAGYEYVGGFENYHSMITIRCRTCGTESRHYFRNLRDKIVSGCGGLVCFTCKKKETDKKNRERQTEHQREIQAKRDARISARQTEEAEQLSREMEKRLAIHVCRNCGKQYAIAVTGYDSENYCSQRCSDRWHSRINNDRRLRRIKSRLRDADITLEKLYERDGGVCYICGRKCDWCDIVRKSGVAIAGDNYPSIEHVKPISKGGLHTWSNVKLACRKCNSEKGWKYSP